MEQIKLSDIIFPFGKYKGEPLTTVLQDAEYCHWFINANLWGPYEAWQEIVANPTQPILEIPRRSKKGQIKYLKDRDICALENVSLEKFNQIMVEAKILFKSGKTFKAFRYLDPAEMTVAQRLEFIYEGPTVQIIKQSTGKEVYRFNYKKIIHLFPDNQNKIN